MRIAPDSERAALEAFAELTLQPGPGYRPVLRVATGRRHSQASGVLRSREEARRGARPLLDTIAVQAEAAYVNAEAARRLGPSMRTLGYRLERTKALTGYDLSDALQRFTLETAAMGARLLNQPEQPPL
ncbi:helix-turn-helix domain-containing protein [Streptomyces kaniharaensis]|uniref:helix-turn-helix domain-containing protein n=1 Tax=Streptomyces kaniharaensis TaxID=212423 RepID=UPI002DDD3B55|nr:helix-turn-helix domain-containing protein [Streptomyces kaniharaensis]